ncbi:MULTISPECIES: hypothetical protein [unclassified Pseudomonas]|uniref:hypothetical protein n=1 Tax=unclassified Pseudomonas TaxID=196821 RepID=UPI001CC0E76D|nr:MULTISPECIES: hypothetical protein [unclassified Pseudomonas]
MYLVVERPYPVDYVHPNGKQAKIDFMWGEASNSAPLSLTVWLKDGESFVRLGEESGIWKTFGDARRRGIELAVKLLSRGI